MNWKKLLKHIFLWIGITFILWVISGDPSSVGIGFLISYLEWRLPRKSSVTRLPSVQVQNPVKVTPQVTPKPIGKE